MVSLLTRFALEFLVRNELTAPFRLALGRLGDLSSIASVLADLAALAARCRFFCSRLRDSSRTTSTLSGPGGEQRVQFLFVCFYPFRESRPEARALIDRLQGIRPLAATSRDPEHQRREQRDDHLHMAIGQQEDRKSVV